MVDERFKSFVLPRQLMDEKFVCLSGCTKDPIKGVPWSKNLRDAAYIEQYVQAGDNYGVTYTTNLAVIDADNLKRLCELCDMDQFKETFRVRSGRSGSIGMHIYLRIPEETIPDFHKGNKVKCSKIELTDPETGEQLGDIRFPHSNFYNVGPFSIHPATKNQYLPVDPGAEIAFFDANQVLRIFDTVIKEVVPKPAYEFKSALQIYRDLDYGFTCFDFLAPVNPRKRADGSIEGVHPIHGSETGTNLTISPDGAMWYCRRDQTGGGWKKALAVAYRIIDCSEANREFTRDEERQIHDVLQILNPDISEKRWIVWQQWKAAHPFSKATMRAQHG